MIINLHNCGNNLFDHLKKRSKFWLNFCENVFDRGLTFYSFSDYNRNSIKLEEYQFLCLLFLDYKL